MRFGNYLSVLGATASLLSLVTSASPAPLVDIEKTTVSLDNKAQSLDDGQIKVHLARVDDLIDEKDHNRLLLERNTHIAINIQLDADNKALNVNGQKIALMAAGQPNGAVAMSAVKAQSYTLPKHMPSDFYQPEHIEELVKSLSTGIVSLEVRLEVEQVPVDTLGHHVSKEMVEAMNVPNVSLRNIGLFMRLVEVEGKNLMHSKNVYAPIVQLMVASNGPHGKIQKVNTLSVAGKPATISAQGGRQSAVKAKANANNIKAQLQAAAHRASKEGPLSGLRNLLNSMMHQPKTKKPCADGDKKHGKAGGVPAGDRIKGLRKGKALAGQNPHRFPTAIESNQPKSVQAGQSRLERVKGACRQFAQRLEQNQREGIIFSCVFFSLVFALVRNIFSLVRSWRASSNPSYEAVQQEEYESEKDKQHLALNIDPPPYHDENGVAKSLYYSDMVDSPPAEVLYDSAEEEDFRDEPVAR